MAATVCFSSVRLTVVMFILFCAFDGVRAQGVHYCWSGSWKVDHTLLNESCRTGATHIPLTLPRSLASRQQPPPSPSLASPPTSPGISSNNLTPVTLLHRQTPLYKIPQHCIIFKYLWRQELEGGVVETTVNTNFTCDHRRLCQGVGNTSRLLMNVNYGGVQGDLYCCSQGNCNDAPTALGLPPHQQLCYHSSNATGTPQVSQAYCRHHTSQCSQRTTTQGHTLRTQYFCDDSNLCLQHGLQPSPKLTCVQNKTESGETEELCCCTGLLCNQRHPFSQPHPVQQPEVGGPPGGGGDWRLVVGLVVALVALLAVVAALAVSLLRSRQKSRAAQSLSSRVLFTYRRIVGAEEASQSNVNLLT